MVEVVGGRGGKGGGVGWWWRMVCVSCIPQNLAAARVSNTSLVGTGLTMEGINQNYVMYDLMMEAAWLPQPSDVLDW